MKEKICKNYGGIFMDAALKRFAAENGMKMAKGCAYGELGGFLVTLSNENNFRSLYLNYMAGADIPEENAKRGAWMHFWHRQRHRAMCWLTTSITTAFR